VANIPEGNLFYLPIGESSWSIEQDLSLSFIFTPSDEDTDNCMLFFHQPFLISIDPWLMSWGSLEMQTQVSP
jgi:hypothetical protein